LISTLVAPLSSFMTCATSSLEYRWSAGAWRLLAATFAFADARFVAVLVAARERLVATALLRRALFIAFPPCSA
jgi:hypothetical protein